NGTSALATADGTASNQGSTGARRNALLSAEALSTERVPSNQEIAQLVVNASQLAIPSSGNDTSQVTNTSPTRSRSKANQPQTGVERAELRGHDLALFGGHEPASEDESPPGGQEELLISPYLFQTASPRSDD